MKRLLALLMALVLSVTMLADTVTAYANEPDAGQYPAGVNGDFDVTGTNSFGNMLANVISEEVAEQQENNGCNVFSVEITGETAVVDLQTTRDSTIVVGIYDEMGTTLKMTATADVTAEDELVDVTFEKSLPQYFYIKAYLIDSESMRPLCTVYESPNYTQEMQEFFAKTTDDFDADRVLNLDDDKTNNFAVYGEDVIVVPNIEGVNILVSEDNGAYVFANADEYFKNLHPGYIFAYEYADGEVLIASVGSVSVDGDTVTIVESDIEMEDAFEYVKIDAEAGMDKIDVDNSDLDEGVEFVGRVSKDDPDPRFSPFAYGVMPNYDRSGNLPSPMAWEDEGSIGDTFNYTIDEKEWSKGNNGTTLKGKVTGEVSLGAKVVLKFYISKKTKYVELSLEYSATLELKLEGSLETKVKIGKMDCYMLPLVKIGFTPYIVLEYTMDATLTVGFSGSVGSRFSNGEFKDISKEPEPEVELDIEGELFFGISLKPHLAIVHEKIADVSLEAKTGLQVTVTNTIYSTPDPDIHHDCLSCLEGEVSWISSLTFELKFFNSGKLSYKKTWENELRCTNFDFYYSIDHNEFGFGGCPYRQFRVNFVVKEGPFIAGRAIEGATVKVSTVGELTTDSSGQTQPVFLSNGKYTVTTSKEGYSTDSKSFKVDGEPITYLLVQLIKDQTEEEPPVEDDPSETAVSIKMVSLGNEHSAAITADGSLYMWGDNYYGQLGNGEGGYSNDWLWNSAYSKVPIKIMDNVASVSLGTDFSAAITEDGSLYMWGDNYYGQLGNGEGGEDASGHHKYSSVPIKIMDNVTAVSLGAGRSAAITEDGSLYMWGSGSLGNGTTEGSYVPTKIMDNVASVSLGPGFSAAITADRNLYTWGSNSSYQLGDGTREDSYVPVHISFDVTSVSLGSSHGAAIYYDGSLLMWGNNVYDCISKQDWYQPYYKYTQIVMYDIASVSLGDSFSAVITTDGGLYMWGLNNHGQLGNGDGGLNSDWSQKYSSERIKIMDNVTYVSLGHDHSAAVTEDGSLYMWGSNNHYKLGSGTIEDSYVPIKIEIPAETSLSAALDTPLPLASTTEPGEPFTGLLPNEIYNVYGMKSRTAAEPFSSGNLLYIAQYTTDASGTLVYDYQPMEDCLNPVIFCKAMREFEVENALITGADVKMNSITVKWDVYQGADMYRIYRVVNGIFIEEGTTSATKYTVEDLASGVEYGFMVASRVNGEWSYQSAQDVVYITTSTEPDPEPEFALGDINGDGKVDVQDGVLMQRILARLESNAEYLSRADLNGDGDVDVQDGVKMQRILANLE